MKIAVIHDQLREFGGAERVLFSILELFPDADIFTSTFDWNSLGKHKSHIDPKKVKTTWFGKIPFVNKYYSPLRFLTPQIWESLDLSSYDLVISSTGSWMCKGVKTKKPTVHISYIHHPPRYLYGYETAIEWQKYWAVKVYAYIVNHFLRKWDFEASQRPDYLIANSVETQSRITKFYHRSSVVIYPPVTIPKEINISTASQDYYITVSRLARAKHVDVLIKAANKHSLPLKVVGVGRDEEVLRSMAGKSVEFVGNVSDGELAKLYEHAKAFVFASVDEEFGIAPVEAMGRGIPVIAFASGGMKETVKNGINGYLYDELTPESFFTALSKFNNLPEEKKQLMRKNSRIESEQYSESNFKKQFMDFVLSHTK